MCRCECCRQTPRGCRREWPWSVGTEDSRCSAKPACKKCPQSQCHLDGSAADTWLISLFTCHTVYNPFWSFVPCCPYSPDSIQYPLLPIISRTNVWSLLTFLVCEKGCGWREKKKKRKIMSPNKSALPSRRRAAVGGAAGRPERFSGPHCWVLYHSPRHSLMLYPGPWSVALSKKKKKKKRLAGEWSRYLLKVGHPWNEGAKGRGRDSLWREGVPVPHHLGEEWVQGVVCMAGYPYNQPGGEIRSSKKRQSFARPHWSKLYLIKFLWVGQDYESWKLKNHLHNASQHHFCSHLSEIWILKSS